MSDTNNIQAAIDAGGKIVDVDQRIAYVGPEELPVALKFSDCEETVELMTDVLKEMDARALTPRRCKGTSMHLELESFIAHVNKFKTEEGSVIFADASNRLVAVLNYNIGPNAPQWGDHRSVYTSPLSRQWKLWTSHNETPFTQDKFGEWIDNNMADLAGSERLEEGIASPAAVLQMARNLVVRTKGEFSRTINPTTGEGSLVNKLENESTSTPIPRAFLLQLPVFEQGTKYRVEARIRFSMPNGKPSFAYSLADIDLIRDDAFAEVRKVAAEKTGLVVFAGAPE